MSKGFYHTKESVDLYLEMTENINGQELIDQFTKHLPSKASILELGTGPGHDWEILSKDFYVIGTDLSDEFLDRLRSKYPSGNFTKIHAANLEYHSTVDAIYSNKVLHHLTDDELKKSVSRQSEILSPRGIICHSFWKGNSTEEFQGMFVNNHTEKDLKHFFENQFEILHLESYKEFEKGDSILLIARKK